jgi:hypothetical protein
MNETFKEAVVVTFTNLPDDCRSKPASETQLRFFETKFGEIPSDFRWYLANCGGGVCGREWIDDIERLEKTQRKFKLETGPEGWKMRGVFVIGWDASGNPFGIERSSGRVLVEDHHSGSIDELAASFPRFLVEGYGLQAAFDSN